VAIAAWQFPVGYGWSIVPSDWDGESEIRKVLAATTDEVFGSNRPTNMSLRAVQGYPSQVLLDESMDALMLVVGSRGHGGFAGLLLGSVSAAVAEHATCPVLVVHGDRLPPAVAA
jgi:nucleotide-binding universal stress UspA family protein